MTPYSSLAGGRLSKRSNETSKRLIEDDYAKLKYGSTAQQDSLIIERVMQLADKYHVSMSEIALAWLLKKVCAPIVGATKITHAETAAQAVELELTQEDMTYLEELYVPHRLVGVMAQNTKEDADKKHVWNK